MTDADTAWLSSEAHELPDGTTARLTLLASNLADLVGLEWRRGGVDRIDYPGYIQDAAVTLWAAKLHELGREAILGAIRQARQDPESAIADALEWWEAWFRDNGWQGRGEEHLRAVGVAQTMWADVMSATTTPVCEDGGGEDGAGGGLGK